MRPKRMRGRETWALNPLEKRKKGKRTATQSATRGVAGPKNLGKEYEPL